MFDTLDECVTAPPDRRRLTTAGLVSQVLALAELDEYVDDGERIDQIRALEELKSAAGAAQARVSAAFAASQRATQREAGVPASQVGRGIAAQVGLAKRESPARATRYLGWASILVAELPGTYAALQAGRIPEWRAMIVSRETGWLSREHRAAVDVELAPQLHAWGDRQTAAEAKRAAYRLDPHGYLARIRGAEADRRVSLRPAPDAMALLSGLLPVAAGVAVYASLTSHADTQRASGDQRSRGQIMADTLVERVTGQATASAVPVEINLIMTDTALFNTRSPSTRHRRATSAGADAGADEPAHLDGYGPIPAELARRLILNAEETGAHNKAKVWLRRLYRHPTTGELAASDSTRRHFPAGLRAFLILRDQICRTPWCDAPIRHADHVTPAERRGPTSARNGQGLCEACNHTKQVTGWTARPGPGGAGNTVTITTPTGHRYTSRPPHPPGHTRTEPPLKPAASVAEEHLRQLLLAA